MHLPTALHLDVALEGLVVGALTTVALVGVGARRSAWVRVGLGWVAAVAAVVAMATVRPVRRDGFDDVTAGTGLAVVATGLVTGAAWARLARVLGAPAVVAVALLSGAGVWAAVPDTEATVAVVAGWVPLAGWVLWTQRERSDAPLSAVAVLGAGAAATVLAASAAWGVGARHPVLPGALTCLVVASAVALGGAGLRNARPPVAAALVVVHAAGVLAASRWAARVGSVADGVARSTLVLVLAAATAAVVAQVSRRAGAPALPPPCDREAHRG